MAVGCRQSKIFVFLAYKLLTEETAQDRAHLDHHEADDDETNDLLYL
jgi:hypothetical protein